MSPKMYREIETGVLYKGDNLRRLAQFPDNCIDLIYLDPPFFSNRNYEVIWGEEAEIRSFVDRWQGGIKHYTDWMKNRLVEMHRILKETGSLYLHCDPTASHYLKVMLDQIFERSPGGFRSEIIWKRSSAHNDTKQGRRLHGHIHDVILFYTKGEEWTWNPLYTAYDQDYVEKFYKHLEPGTNRLYTLSDITGPGGASKGNPSYAVMGVTRYWRYSKERMQELIDEGRIVQSKPGTVPRQKRYLDEMPGVPLQDVWTDLKPALRGSERVGYPTQKPESLLERIIESSTDPGQIVLDPFCGCGTTIAVAQQLRREWIGIDVSQKAVSIMKTRVDKLGANAKVVGLPKSLADLKELGHFEFENWVVDRVGGQRSAKKSRDMGIDGWSFFERLPIQAKQHRKPVGREYVDKFETAVERSGKHMGYLVAFDFTKDAYEEAARSREVGRNAVTLVRVEDVLTFAELIEDAEQEKRILDLSSASPDLMSLFSIATAEARDKKQKRGVEKHPVPSKNELEKSVRKPQRAR
jgi:DNA modification methylase